MANPAAKHYGYPLGREASVRSGVLYPILDRLERAGWLAGEWEEPDKHSEGRPRRRYYTVTESGKVGLTTMLRGEQQ
jgi:PadR family transcriptional regulator, regulatory protein PadR